MEKQNLKIYDYQKGQSRFIPTIIQYEKNTYIEMSHGWLNWMYVRHDIS